MANLFAMLAKRVCACLCWGEPPILWVAPMSRGAHPQGEDLPNSLAKRNVAAMLQAQKGCAKCAAGMGKVSVTTRPWPH